MEMNKRFYKVLLSKYSVFIILSCIFSFVYNERIYIIIKNPAMFWYTEIKIMLKVLTMLIHYK